MSRQAVHEGAAACVMGQLRSALSTAVRVGDGPAEALDALGLYARYVEGAESTTAVKTFIDWDSRSITCSSAGHPPPAPVHPDGTTVFLDRATDPPLGARPEHVRRPQATVSFPEGATLVLYTDGLIERRAEDIDTGVARLAGSLTRHRHAGPEALADALPAGLLPATGDTDDTALVIIRLCPRPAHAGRHRRPGDQNSRSAGHRGGPSVTAMPSPPPRRRRTARRQMETR